MARASGCARHSVCFLAFFTWMVGGAMVGFTMWMLATSRTVRRFFSGTLIFTYVLISIGSLLFLTGLLGWIGSYRRGSCLMKMFLLLSVLSVAAEIGGIVALNILRMKMADILESGWKEVNQQTRNLIQNKFECCGFRGPEEFAYNSDPIDDSCYNHVGDGSEATVLEVKMLNRSGCKEKLVGWFYTNKIIWIVSLGVVLLLQVTSVLLAVYVINQMKQSERGTSSTQSLPITQSYL